MTSNAKKDFRRVVLLYLIVQIVILVLVVSGVYLQQRNILLNDATASEQNELKMAGMLIREAMFRQDYATVEWFTNQWGLENKSVNRFIVTLNNGLTVADYRRVPPAKNVLAVTDTVTGLNNDMATLYLESDLREIYATSDRLLKQLIIGSTLFTLLFGIFVWELLRRRAWGPLLEEIEVRKRFEQLLRKKEKENRRLLESAGEAIYATDHNGICTFINQSACEMLGYERNDLLGQFIHNFIHHTHIDGTPCPSADCPILASLDKGEGTQVDEDQFWRKDGRSFPVRYVSYPLTDGNHIIGTVVTFHDMTDIDEKVKSLAHEASHDPLTGLFNRREFENRLESALESAQVRHLTHALLYLDLDRFKPINDEHGHEAGDDVLQGVAEAMSRHLRQRDTLARVGGDEFAILMENCPPEKAQELAGKIQQQVIDSIFMLHDGSQCSVGVSVGVVIIDDESRDVKSLLRRADDALYEQKRRSHIRAQQG